MTEKRFVKGYCCGDTGLVDKEKEEWFVENINSISDSERNWNDVLDKLNEVADENEELKLISNHRGEMVSFATSLIQDMGSEEMLKMWNDFTEVMYQKWKKKRGIK